MDEDFRQRLLQNRFASKLEFNEEIDDQEFHSLCAALVDLAEAWRAKPLIEKNLVALLKGQLDLTRKMIDHFEVYGPEEKNVILWERWSRLDELVNACLSESRTGPDDRTKAE